jgi:hypothetical protein
MGLSISRENGSAVYNCCLSSPAQSFLGPSPAGLVIIFYCFRFETPPTCKARSPYLYHTGTGWLSCTLRHWVHFRRLLRLTKFRWRFSKPPPRGSQSPAFCQLVLASHCIASGNTTTQRNIYPLPSNEYTRSRMETRVIFLRKCIAGVA